jgi:hypothetical protein
MPATATLRRALMAITAMPPMIAHPMGTTALIGSLAASLSAPAPGSVAAAAFMVADVASTAGADTTAAVADSMDAAGMALMVVAQLAAVS